MSMDAEEWMRVKIPDRTRKPEHSQEAGKSRGRDIIFRTLLPGVFIYLLAYYAFVHQPFVADFYCGILIGNRPAEPVKPLPSSLQPQAHATQVG